MWPFLVTLGLCLSLPALHTCGAPRARRPGHTSWKQKVGATEVAPSSQDHWQAQSVGSCTV